jgi:hypothetical protein
MTVYNWLCLFGVPTFIAAVIKYIYSVIKDIKALKLGIQAVLRSQMIEDYQKWRDCPDGVPLYVRESFVNCWEQYEALGANGVMSDLHNRFMALPIGEREQ